jgi:tetratricopeptide (TPR) repeat protein
MDTAPSYFLPPFEGPWRVAQVLETPLRIRIEWLQEDSLATDWEISLVSVTQVRERQGPPDPDEALAAGLLPGLTDGAAHAQIHEESAQQALFVCTWSGDFAKSDQTLAVRLRVDGKFLVGIACRMRPPIEARAATALLERMRAAQCSYDAPESRPLDPARDERFSPELEPYLRALDQSMEHDDFGQALETIDTLRPALALAPLSRFALNLHIAEGWAHMRSALAGDEGGSARAIEMLRKTLDNIEPGEHRDLYGAASTWLAEAYAKRNRTGDLQHAIEAFRVASGLDDAQASPARVAQLHLRMGMLHHHLARELSDGQADRLELALAELDRAEVLYGSVRDTAGLAETAIAKADAVRLLGSARGERDAGDLYGVAWNILQQDNAHEALGPERYEMLLEHVRTSMRRLDASQRSVRAAKPEPANAPPMAIFVRPATSKRRILVQPPGDDAVLPLEAALSRALGPDVSIAPVDGMAYPQAGNAAASVSVRRVENARAQARTSLEQSRVVFLMLGITPGIPWELQYLRDQGWLTKALLIMIPGNLGFSVPVLWERARSEAFEHGVDLPPYSGSGALMRLNRDGNVVRRLPFDAIWEPGRLLQAMEDLLSKPQEMLRPEPDSARRLAELEHKGLVRRVRPRGTSKR